MKTTSIKAVLVDSRHRVIQIGKEIFPIEDILMKYQESKLFSYLQIECRGKTFLVRGWKSIWEHLNISTYDVLEKREDNKVFDLYCHVRHLKNESAQ
jgi:hypothetical protein